MTGPGPAMALGTQNAVIDEDEDVEEVFGHLDLCNWMLPPGRSPLYGTFEGSKLS